MFGNLPRQWHVSALVSSSPSDLVGLMNLINSGPEHLRSDTYIPRHFDTFQIAIGDLGASKRSRLFKILNYPSLFLIWTEIFICALFSHMDLIVMIWNGFQLVPKFQSFYL